MQLTNTMSKTSGSACPVVNSSDVSHLSPSESPTVVQEPLTPESWVREGIDLNSHSQDHQIRFSGDKVRNLPFN